MKKQRVCVIGGGLTGLVTSIALSELNLDIDLIASNFYQNYRSIRTTALSHDSYLFLKKNNVFNFNQADLWPCNEVRLYEVDNNLKREKVLNFSKEDKNNLLYMITNNKISQIMKDKIRNNYKINVKSNIEVKKLFDADGIKFIETFDKNSFKYDLIILCTGKNSFLTKEFLGTKYSDFSSDETSVINTIDHERKKNNIARQFFLEEGPLAFLPISSYQTSIVWSVKNFFLNQRMKNRDLLIKKNLKNFVNNFYKNVKFIHKFEYDNLNFHFSHTCYNERVLIFGDALHSVHPLVGQGFNMILRDLKKLQMLIKEKNELGLDIGSTLVLSDFEERTKYNNFIFTLGIETIKKVFLNNNSISRKIRNYYLSRLNYNKIIKDFFINLADKGINL